MGITMAELGLKKKEVEAIEFAFDVYDFKGDGNVDAFYAGDLIRACNLNPTLKTIQEIGGATEKGKKMLKKADVFPMYKACKDSKDQGGFHDFVEILKLYDKNDDNTMLGNELFRLLTNLGAQLRSKCPTPSSDGLSFWDRAPGYLPSTFLEQLMYQPPSSSILSVVFINLTTACND